MPIKIKEIVRSIKNTFIFNVIMFAIVFSLNFLNCGNVIKLILQMFIGIIMYLILGVIFKDDNHKICVKLVSKILNK